METATFSQIHLFPHCPPSFSSSSPALSCLAQSYRGSDPTRLQLKQKQDFLKHENPQDLISFYIQKNMETVIIGFKIHSTHRWNWLGRVKHNILSKMLKIEIVRDKKPSRGIQSVESNHISFRFKYSSFKPSSWNM